MIVEPCRLSRPEPLRRLPPELSPDPSEVEAILSNLERRNRIRAKAKLPQLDVHGLAARELSQLAAKKYEALLKPFYAVALMDVPESIGLAGRLRRHLRALRIAERSLEATRGIGRPEGASRAPQGPLWDVLVAGKQRH